MYPRRITACATGRLACSHWWVSIVGWRRRGLPGVARSAIRRSPYTGKRQAHHRCCYLTYILRRPMLPARTCTTVAVAWEWTARCATHVISMHTGTLASFSRQTSRLVTSLRRLTGQMSNIAIIARYFFLQNDDAGDVNKRQCPWQ